MASSDDEGEAVPQSVTNYHFVDDNNAPISFSVLPIQWGETDSPAAEGKQIFLHGTADSGLQKVYKQVTAWKLDLSDEQVEISVLSKDNNWIKLQKPRRSYEEEMIRSILITVHCLQFAKKNPEASDKVLWDHLRKISSSYEVRASENDLLDHLPLISSMVKRDEGLAKSKSLLAFLEENPKKRKLSDEDIQTGSDSKKSKFIVDDGEDVDEEIKDADADESDEEPDSFDSVCAICDNGGDLLCCEGMCLRSFHATKVPKADGQSPCTGLGLSKAQVEAIQNFLCANCQHKRHQCFACGKLGSSDKSSGAEVFRCVSATCGHFYHPLCIAKLLHPGNEAESEEHQKKIAAGESFTCPLHKCLVCKKGENKEVKELQLAICRRCPTAYHRKCLPREIAFEDEEEEDIIQRAWELDHNLIIYCLKHTIDEDLGTPIRNHITFPDTVQKKKARPLEKIAKKKNVISEDTPDERIATMKKKTIGEKKDVKERESTKISEKSPTGLGELSKKSKATISSKPWKDHISPKVDKSSTLEDNKAFVKEMPTSSVPNKGSNSVKSVPKDLPSSKCEKTSIAKSSTSLPVIDSETEKKIMAMVKRSSSSLTLEEITKKHKVPSTHSYSSRHVDKTITHGKVEGYVEALRTALQKLEEGCSIEDAKAVCEPSILNQIIKWKNKLKVYLSPFLHGMRYTSFGRHFTKVDKLKEIVEKLHWYVQNGDTIVDFCCGANDFSIFMKNKLEETGKNCFFKNYDVIQPKNDFKFEKRDWMTVRFKELPTGSQLIMGLNPPFGVKAALANKFIEKALEFKPKLLILMVPKETERLDEKEQAYDLLWEDSEFLTGKSFYLPGSVDVNDKQMEQWNLKPPVLYLWSRPDWTKKQMDVAIRYGHISKLPEESLVKENHEEMRASDKEEDRDLYGDVSKILNDPPILSDLYGDISKILNDPPILNDQVEALEETRTVSPEEEKEVSPPKHDSRTDRSRREEDKRIEGRKNSRRKRDKRSRESPTEREDKRKQSWDKDETTEGKHGSRTLIGDKGTPTEIRSPLNRTDSKSFLEDHPSEAFDTPLEREGSEEGFQRFQHDRSGSASEFGTGYGGTRMSIPDEELNDIEKRYRNKDVPFAPGAWSSSNSGIRGFEGRFPSYTNDNTNDSFNRNSYMDVHRLTGTFGQQEVDPAERYGRPSVDLLRQGQFYGQQGPNEVPHRSWLPLGQDSGLGQTGPLSSTFGLSALTPDPSRIGSSVTQRYAPRLDEMNYTRLSPFTGTEASPVGPRSIFNTPGSQGGLHSDMQGFASGPHRHFPRHNSAGWLND